jgi:hypothetical protein
MVASALKDLGAGLAGLLPLAFMLGPSLFRFAQGADRARAIVDAFLVWTIVSYGATKLLDLFGQIAFLPFLVHAIRTVRCARDIRDGTVLLLIKAA